MYSKTTPELSYVIGVLLGDGYLLKTKAAIYPRTGTLCSSYRLSLMVTDREFAERFAFSCSRVLKRPDSANRNIKVYGPRIFNKTGKLGYQVCPASRTFGDWWETLSEADLTKYALIEPRNYLRALYDSDGNLSFGATGWPNVRIFKPESKLRAIRIALECLHALGMDASLRIFRHAGVETNFGVSKQNLYVLSPAPSRSFLQQVGSSIPRKNL